MNPRLRIASQHIGREREPLVVIDDLMRDPRQLVEYAAREVKFGKDVDLGLYPGTRAAAPLDYVEAVAKAVDPIIRQVYALGGVKLARAECSFSLVTTPPEALQPLQTLPHVDTSYPLQFALLHYLCGEEFGGTAFYRQNATGFETLSPDREEAYDKACAAELARLAGKRPGYIAGSTQAYEQIGSVSARMDRLIVYRSCLLHSGAINAGAWEMADPRTGRLTGNIFLSYRPE